MKDNVLPGVLLIESDREVAKEVIEGLSGKARVIWHTRLKNPDGIISKNGIDLIILGEKETRHVILSAQKNNFQGIILANTGHKKSNRNLLNAGAHFLIEQKDSSFRTIANYI